MRRDKPIKKLDLEITDLLLRDELEKCPRGMPLSINCVVLDPETGSGMAQAKCGLCGTLVVADYDGEEIDRSEQECFLGKVSRDASSLGLGK